MLKNLVKKIKESFYSNPDTNTLPDRISDKLLDDFYKRKTEIENANIASSLSTLKELEIQKELNYSGLLLTQNEAEIRATKTFLELAMLGKITTLGKIKRKTFIELLDYVTQE